MSTTKKKLPVKNKIIKIENGIHYLSSPCIFCGGLLRMDQLDSETIYYCIKCKQEYEIK